MHSENKPNPAQLQRLIDGELSTVEIKELLEVADQHPSHWRTIACTFTEDALFRHQFESLDENLAPKPVKKIAAITPQEPPSQSMPLVRQLAIAAGLAVAGLVGYMVGSDGPMATPEQPIGTSVIAKNDQPMEPSVTPVDLQPEYRMELLTPDGESIDGEVDLYRYGDLHRLVENRSGQVKDRVTLSDVLPPSGFSQEARQRLNRSGYDVNESTNYISGRLQDGRQFVVPVRSIRFDRGH